MKLNLKIDGMGCEHDVKIGSAEVEAENDSVLNEIREKLDDAGYDLV